MTNKFHRKIIIVFLVIGAGLYWRGSIANATMKLLEVAQGVIRVRSSPQNGLVGYWNFDECDTCTTAADKSGNGNTGTMYNAAGPTAGNLHTSGGKIGNGIDLDGSNDYVQASRALTATTYSISAWINPNRFGVTNQGNGIFYQGTGSSDLGTTLLIATCPACTVTNGNTGTLFFTHEGGTTFLTAADNAITLNTWQHVVITKSGANETLYINGTPQSSRTNGGTAAPSNNSSFLGVLHTLTDVNRFFQGQIDDVRVYNRALSADEITRLYEEGSFRTTINANQNSMMSGGLVGMWSFNGPDVDWASTTAEILDRSGNGLNGDALGITKNSVRTGIVGQALNFDGVDDYVGVSANASLSLGTSMTISIWFNRRSTTGLQTLASSNKYYAVGFNGNWIFRITDGTALAFASYDGQSNEQGGGFAFTINNNVWNHAVVSIDGATATVYLNGVASASGPLTHTKALIDAGVSGMSIGDDLNWVNVPFDGLIDDVRIYNRALNASEIKELYLSSARQ